MTDDDIELNWSEVWQAIIGGCCRQVNAIRTGRRDTYGPTDRASAWGVHIEGAAGEIAVARRTGLYWSGRRQWAPADIGVNLQARTTSPGNRLIVRARDSDDAVFVFVTGQIPRFTIHGWIVGRDAKDPAYLADPTGDGYRAYFVPADRLHPMSTLRLERTATHEHDDDRRTPIPFRGR